MRCLSTGLGVALVSHWVALLNPLSDFSFQLSAFQLLPNCGFEWLWLAFPAQKSSRFRAIHSGRPPDCGFHSLCTMHSDFSSNSRRCLSRLLALFGRPDFRLWTLDFRLRTRPPPSLSAFQTFGVWMTRWPRLPDQGRSSCTRNIASSNALWSTSILSH